MPECPRCHQPLDSQAISCPYCRTPLKAYGHPGIPLHRSQGDEFLCTTCTYHADDTCNYPKRPHAKECTLYQNLAEFQQQSSQRSPKAIASHSLKLWLKQNSFLVILGTLILVSLLISLLS